MTRNPEGGRGTDHWDTDWAGRGILERYLTGGGDWTIDNDPDWNRYMMDNDLLADQLHPKVQNLAIALYDQYQQTGQQTAKFNDTFQAEIENGEGIVGYQYLHGTNKDTGGFTMRGNATLTATRGGYEVRVDSDYTWNDRIDPNPEYSTDSWKSAVAEVVTLGQADPYDIHISWRAETVVRLDHNGNVISVEGVSGTVTSQTGCAGRFRVAFALAIGLLVAVGSGACQRGETQMRQDNDVLATPDHPATSPSGRYALEVLSGRVTTGTPQGSVMVARFRISEVGGKILYEDDTDYALRHTTFFLWADDTDQAWVYSGDVGTSYVERDATGAWTKRDFFPDRRADPPTFLKQARPAFFDQ